MKPANQIVVEAPTGEPVRLHLGPFAVMGRLNMPREEAAVFKRPDGAVCIFLESEARSIRTIGESDCQISIQCTNGEYWIENRNLSHPCLVNQEVFTRKKLLINDRLAVSEDFHFRFDGTALWQVSLRQGAEIEAISLKKSYRKRTKGLKWTQFDALKEASLSIQPNEFIGIIGPSGSGKSTLMGLLSGALVPSSGKVLINGLDTATRKKEVSSMMSIVPQDDIVHGELSLIDAVLLSAHLRLPSRSGRNAKLSLALKCISDLGLWEHRHKRIRELSGGQRKRASIAVEILKESSVFFLDEPTSGLDSAAEKELMFTLYDLAEKGRTIICTTHNLDRVDLFSRIIVVARGYIRFFGTVDDCRRHFGVEEMREIYSKLEKEEDPTGKSDGQHNDESSDFIAATDESIVCRNYTEGLLCKLIATPTPEGWSEIAQMAADKNKIAFYLTLPEHEAQELMDPLFELAVEFMDAGKSLGFVTQFPRTFANLREQISSLRWDDMVALVRSEESLFAAFPMGSVLPADASDFSEIRKWVLRCGFAAAFGTILAVAAYFITF